MKRMMIHFALMIWLFVPVVSNADYLEVRRNTSLRVQPDRNAAVVEQVLAPGLEVTVYLVIFAPPVDFGAFHLTVACAFPAVAVTPVGAPGLLAFFAACTGDADTPVTSKAPTATPSTTREPHRAPTRVPRA